MDVCNLVNCLLILVDKVEHVICHVLAGMNVMGYHLRLKQEALKDAVPLRKDDYT